MVSIRRGFFPARKPTQPVNSSPQSDGNPRCTLILDWSDSSSLRGEQDRTQLIPSNFILSKKLEYCNGTDYSIAISACRLVPDHYHLLIHTPMGNLSRYMRHVNGVHTQRFNKAHGCDGQLFRGRFKAILVDGDSFLLQLVRYIHRNPLRAGLAERLDQYPWSGHRGGIRLPQKGRTGSTGTSFSPSFRLVRMLEWQRRGGLRRWRTGKRSRGYSAARDGRPFLASKDRSIYRRPGSSNSKLSLGRLNRGRSLRMSRT